MDELLAEREALKQQIADLRERANSPDRATAALAQEALKPLLDDFRTLSIAIASNQARVTPSPTHELERLDERGDVIRAGQPNQSARVVKVRDPKTGTVTDWPDPSTAVPKPTPTPIGEMERLDANGILIQPGDVTTKAAKMRDPKTGTVTDLPDVAAGGRPTVVDGDRGQKFSWDGTTLKELTPATPEKPQAIQGAGGAIYSWDGKTFATLQAGKPEPKEGDTRPNVKDGYNVTEHFLGGDWVVTKYGDPAKPGQPTEGMTRPNTKEGYKVTETYTGGDWTVTDVGERATPREPTSISAPADQPYLVRTNAQGQPENIPNPNYQPKTQADIAARVGQIQTQANAKKNEILQKYASDPDKGLAEFNTWWDSNVQPQMGALQAATEEANFARGKEMATMRTSAQTAALGAGTLAQRSLEDQARRTVAPGFAEEMGKVWNATAQGQRAGPIDYTKALNRPEVDVNAQAQAAVAEALKYIDPTAAQMTGGGSPTWMATNPADALNRSSYTPSFGPAAAPAAPAPAPAGPSPDLFHATPIMTTPEGQTQFQYPFVPADADYQAQQQAALEAQQAQDEAQVTADLQALMAQQRQNNVYQYGGAPAPALVRRRPAPVPVAAAVPFNQQALAAGLGAGGLGPTAPLPFYQQALAAGLGAGGLGPEQYYPPQYQYGGMNPEQYPW